VISRGDFVLQQELGKSETTTCVSVTRKSDGACFVIKSFQDFDATELADYARKQRQCLHPNILSPIAMIPVGDDFDIPGGLLFEWMPGGSLQEQVCVLSSEQKSFIIRDVVAAIDSLQSSGIVHGNVKPGNILLGAGFVHAKLSDCASKPGRQISGSTREFAAPEMVNREGATLESDIWSLACVLYFLVSGKLPFDPNIGYRKLDKGTTSGQTPALPKKLIQC
jgi:serine/threonine protein kinase